MEDIGAGVFGDDPPRHRGSAQLSSKVPYSYRQELKESRPTEIADYLARAVDEVVSEERAFENGEHEFPASYKTVQGKPEEDPSLAMCGWFEKLSSGRKGDSKWQRRWFELICNRLYCFKDPDHEMFTKAVPLDEVVSILVVAKVDHPEIKEHHQGLLGHLAHHRHEESGYEMAMTTGRSHGRIYKFRYESAEDRDQWMGAMWRSKVRANVHSNAARTNLKDILFAKFAFHAAEMKKPTSLMDRLVVMCCLKESSDAKSFLFESDNTFVEDLIAHYIMAAAILIELVLRNRLELRDDKVSMLDSQYTGVGLLDDAIDIVHWCVGSDGTCGLSQFLSKLSGVAEMKKNSVWEKAKSLLGFRWPGASFRARGKSEGALRLPKDEKYSISDAWNRAIIVAAQHRLLRYESGTASSSTGHRTQRWVVINDDFEVHHTILLRNLMSGTFDPADDWELAFSALAVAMLDVKGREILDYNRVFVPADGDRNDISAALKKNLGKHMAANKSKFSNAVRATLQQTLQSIYCLLDFTRSSSSRRSSVDEGGQRTSLSRRYSLDATPKQI